MRVTWRAGETCPDLTTIRNLSFHTLPLAADQNWGTVWHSPKAKFPSLKYLERKLREKNTEARRFTSNPGRRQLSGTRLVPAPFAGVGKPHVGTEAMLQTVLTNLAASLARQGDAPVSPGGE